MIERLFYFLSTLFSRSQNYKKSNPKHVKSMPCNYYNAGRCSHSKTHETRGVLYKHVCSACLPQASLLVTQRPNAFLKIKKFQKTIERQKRRVYYSLVVSKSSQESNMDKHTALCHFSRYKAYQKTNANKSYADALKFGKHSPVNVKSNAYQIKKNKSSDLGTECVKTNIIKTPANLVSVTTCFTKIYKQKSPESIT